jgi:predicted membrane metal-binding protein
MRNGKIFSTDLCTLPYIILIMDIQAVFIVSPQISLSHLTALLFGHKLIILSTPGLIKGRYQFTMALRNFTAVFHTLYFPE